LFSSSSFFVSGSGDTSVWTRPFDATSKSQRLTTPETRRPGRGSKPLIPEPGGFEGPESTGLLIASGGAGGSEEGWASLIEPIRPQGLDRAHRGALRGALRRARGAGPAAEQVGAPKAPAERRRQQRVGLSSEPELSRDALDATLDSGDSGVSG